MATLPDGVDDTAMMAAVAWEIVNYAYLRTSFFSNQPPEEVFTHLTNEFIRARSAIYHGKSISVEKK